jgi:hypothetical protein
MKLPARPTHEISALAAGDSPKKLSSTEDTPPRARVRQRPTYQVRTAIRSDRLECGCHNSADTRGLVQLFEAVS